MIYASAPLVLFDSMNDAMDFAYREVGGNFCCLVKLRSFYPNYFRAEVSRWRDGRWRFVNV